MRAPLFCVLADVSVGEGETPLPTERRLFAAGMNETSKGTLLFDEQAAASVMAAFVKGGVDLMIDLNHDSLDKNALASRADAGDARGWAKLEVRNGELWLVNMTWTPEGAERLTCKKQRYLSPAFCYDAETRRIEEVYNVAICAMPATFGAQPLMAASRAFDRKVSAKVLERVVTALAKAKRERHGSKTHSTGA